MLECRLRAFACPFATTGRFWYTANVGERSLMPEILDGERCETARA